MTLDPRLQQRVTRLRIQMASKDDAYRALTDQRAATVRDGLLQAGVTDMTSAAVGWLEAQVAVLATLNALVPVIGPCPTQLLEAVDNLLATGLQLLDTEERKAPKLIVPGDPE